jgi:hypothetical protein
MTIQDEASIAKLEKRTEDRFLPCTREVDIGDNVVYRPIRSWHNGAYAGEHRTNVDGDGSGCMKQLSDHRQIADVPRTAIHRLYWNRKNPENTVSAFLSYPDGMGAVQRYFWENYPAKDSDDVSRHFSEEEMENEIREMLKD